MIYYLIYSAVVGFLCLILFLLLRREPKQKDRPCDHCAHLEWKRPDSPMCWYRCAPRGLESYTRKDDGPTVCKDYTPNEAALDRDPKLLGQRMREYLDKRIDQRLAEELRKPKPTDPFAPKLAPTLKEYVRQYVDEELRRQLNGRDEGV